eukprot:COSAG01_NODE_14550_length_1439_cov_1.479104_1_plen_99_part_10
MRVPLAAGASTEIGSACRAGVSAVGAPRGRPSRQQTRWTCEHAALSKWHRCLTCIEPPPAPAAGVLTEATAPSATWTGVCHPEFLDKNRRGIGKSQSKW